MVVHFDLGAVYCGHIRCSLLSAYSHRQPRFHVRLSPKSCDSVLVSANGAYRTIAQAQLLNLPISVVGLLVIFVTGYFADGGRLPRPLYPLTFLIVIIASYSVLIVYPSNGGVYAATLIGNAVTAAWFPMMWPWRVQTTSGATGSAFSIGFVNSYGQIGGAIGPQSTQSPCSYPAHWHSCLFFLHVPRFSRGPPV